MFKRIKEYSDFRRLKKVYTKYERALIPGALLFGFMTDIIFFSFINFNFALVTLTLHLTFAALSIAIINFYEEGLARGKIFTHLRFIAPLVLQFTFGALFSSFVIFYSFSGSVFASWPFILIIVFLMIANELFRKYNTRPDIHLAVWFFALFSFLNLSMPYLLRSLGSLIFIFSGVLSLVIVTLLLWFFSHYTENIRNIRKRLIALIAIIFISMNVLYFANLIPPIPLTIQDIGIYNYARRVNGEYMLVSREEGIMDKLRPGKRFYVDETVNQAYVFSSVFAPPGMSLEITHEWQFRDLDAGWTTISTVPFRISGGREGGFRGFTKTFQLEPGKWRVNVRTEHGQIIGRYNFRVVVSDDLSPFVTDVR